MGFNSGITNLISDVVRVSGFKFLVLSLTLSAGCRRGGECHPATVVPWGAGRALADL